MLSQHPDFDLILFDLDGTLLESATELTDAVNDTLHDAGLAPVTLAQVEIWIGHGTRELLVQALASVSGQPPDAVRSSRHLSDWLPVFDRHYLARCGTRSQLYPQVAQTLTRLRQQGVQLGVVTNKDSRFVQPLVQRHGLTEWLDFVVCGDNVPRKKPDPVGLLDTLTKAGVPSGRALMVGDSAIDVATARAAGVTVWAVPYGYNQGHPIADCQPDRIIPDCSALLY